MSKSKSINKKYTPESLDNALHAIRNGMTYKKASKQFNIPRTTLIDKINKKYNKQTAGAPKILTMDEENIIVNWIINMGEAGLPVTKTQLLESVGDLVLKLKRPNTFKNGIPGRHWYEAFLSRHPDLAQRVSQNVTRSRAAITERSIRAWFERVKTFFIKEGKSLDIFNDPRRVFNTDETAFFLAPQEKQVVVRKGSKKVYNRIVNDDKECLTVLLTISASGETPPPLVLFPYKRIPPSVITKMPSDWAIGRSTSGWMTSENFYEFVTNVFYRWLLQNNVPLPVIFFIDGHSSHINLPLITFCKEAGIILTALLPNSTHILQPLDAVLFKPLKQNWKDAVYKWRTEHQGEKLKRDDFSALLKSTVEDTCTAELISKGFETCGLCPFNADRVDYSKLVTKKIIINENTDKPDACTCDEDIKFLEKFEKRLDPVTLKKFEECNINSWCVDVSYLELYNFWKNIRKCHKLHGSHQNMHWQEIDNNNSTENLPIKSNEEHIQSANNEELIKENLHGQSSNNNWININNSQAIENAFIDDQISEENGELPNLNIDANRSVEIVDNMKIENPADDQIWGENGELLNLNMNANESVEIVDNMKIEDTVVGTETENEHMKSLFDSDSILKDSMNTLQKDTLPIKVPTPFKTELYWPIESEISKKSNKLRKCIPKITPTVAISSEFIEYKERIDTEEEQKAMEKLERMRKRKAVSAKKISKMKRFTTTISTGPLNDETRTQNEKTETNENVITETDGTNENKQILLGSKKYNAGDYVVVNYEDKFYPGCIIERATQGFSIKTMAMSGPHWRWPNEDDVLIYQDSDIICQIKDPVLINSRGQYNVSEIKDIRSNQKSIIQKTTK